MASATSTIGSVRLRPGVLLVVAKLVAVALCGPAPLQGQAFGRWWWDGRLSLGQRQNDSLVDGVRLRRFAEQRAELSLGLNGYILHPAIGDFRLGVDLLLADYEGARLADSDRFGAELLLNFLQQGRYPANLYYRRSVYDNAPEAGEDPFSLLGIVDASDQWGGRLRMRNGLLRGTFVGFEHTDIEFLNPQSQNEVQDRQYLDWSRSGEKLNHHLRVERREQDYGTIDLEIEDYTANFDQNGNLTPTLRWELSGVAVLRDIGLGDVTLSSEDYRARSRLLKEIRQRDQLEVRYEQGIFETDLADTRESQALSAYYRWRPREGWEIAPFLAYSRSTIDNLELQTPRAGLSATWRRSKEKLTTGLSARASFGEVERREGDVTLRDSQAAYSLSGSVRRGRANGFRQELEAEASRNDIRFGREPILDLPDVILPQTGLSTEDLIRARATLGWRSDSKRVSGSLEWFSRESSSELALADLSADTIRAALQGGTASLTAQLEAGETTLSEGGLGEQKVTYTTANLTWRPLRLLRFRALYREDRRELILAPDIDSERAEVGVGWRFGAIVLEARAYERTQQLIGGSETTNKGFRWTVSRRHVGWLPIVTGAARRGVIR